MSKRIYLCFLSGFIAVLLACAPSYSAAANDSGEVETASAGPSSDYDSASDSAEVAANAPSDSGEVSANAPADSAEVSATPADPAGGPLNIDASEIASDITKLLSGNKKIFFLEQMAALKMSNEGGSEVEGTLNALYDSRESLAMKLAGLAVRDGSGRALKLIKGRIFGTKLYELYGLDSFASYALSHPEFPEGADGTAAVSAAAAERLKDSLLELKSFIELENSRVVNSNSFIAEFDNFMASLKNDESTAGASDGGGPGQEGGFSNQESKALFSVQEVSPGANSTDAPIASPITVKFDSGKFTGSKDKIAVNVRTASVCQKYSKPASGDTGALKFKWDAAFSLLTITAAAHLQRNALYNVLLVFDHKIPAPAKRAAGEDAPRKGFFRDRSVNAGLFKTVDVDLSENIVKYRFDWNFTTQAYASTSSEAALSSAEPSATEETEIAGNSTAEVDLKDKRGTEENEIGDKAAGGSKNGTAENGVSKKNSIMGELFEQPKNMPMLVNRSPEGVSIMSASEIFVIFSCDIDPKSISNDTMQLFGETTKSKFEKLRYKLKLDGRRLTLIPKTPLSASKNYKVTVTSVRTAKKLDMPINETFYFKTACSVMDAKLSRGKKDKKEETLEITISEDLADLNINFFEIEKKKEKPVEFDRCGKIFAEPQKPARPAIVSLALGADKTAAPKGGGAKTSGKKQAVQNKIIKPQGPVTILLKPKSPLVKGREYKIDVFSTGGVIENGIIKFTAK